ncbi:MAG TPA: outer membrane beta-barrel protein [Gemmatimonadales bacterium]|nr:outer membrane beta-barrel protein [Gemmatimonadales bacterium]
MCSIIRKGLAALAFGLLAATLPLHAQGQGWEVSLGGGVGVPTGDFDDASKPGWHGLAAVSYTLPAVPLALQIDGAFSRFNDEAPATDLKDNIIYSTGNLVYSFKVSETASFVPYVIGGAGVYGIDPTGRDAEGLDSRTKFGFNVGLGMAMTINPGKVFVESRFHNVIDATGATDMQFNNFTAGLRLNPQ